MHAPAPPTLLARSTAEELVTTARRFVASGVPRDEAAGKLAALAPHRTALEAAHWDWTDRMHRLPSDDFEAVAVLRLLLRALALLPHDATVTAAA